jgi:ABC-type multidrug transport system fused ATPase/permease subunit
MTGGLTPRGLRFLRDRWQALVRLGLWSVLETGQTFLIGYAPARALDDGFLRDRTAVGLGWLGVAALGVVLGAFGTARVYAAVAALVEPLRDRLVTRVVERGVRQADRGALSGLTQQVEIARDTFAGLVMVSRSFVFTAVGALAGMFSLAPLLLLVVLPPLLAGVGLFAATLRPLARRQERFLTADEALADRLGALCPGLRDITASGAEERMATDAGTLVDAELRAARSLARFGILRVAALALGGQLPIILLLATAPWLLRHGVTTGALVGALAYVTQSLLPALHHLVHGLGTSGSRLAVVIRRLAPEGADESGTYETHAGDEHRGTGRTSTRGRLATTDTAGGRGRPTTTHAAPDRSQPTTTDTATDRSQPTATNTPTTRSQPATTGTDRDRRPTLATGPGNDDSHPDTTGTPTHQSRHGMTGADSDRTPLAARAAGGPSRLPASGTVADRSGVPTGGRTPAGAEPPAAAAPPADTPHPPTTHPSPTVTPAPSPPPARTPHPPTPRPSRTQVPALSLSSVTFAYGPTAAPVIEDLDLTLPCGSHLAVVGPSGIGKSTLTALVAGVLEPQGGTIRVCGEPVPGPEAAARRVLIPQEAYVFTGSLAENLAHLRPDPVPEAELRAAAEAIGLAPLLEALGGPAGRVDPAALSAGERQLIALTRAYLSPAPLALLDEATCHLDPRAEERAERAFAARPGGTLVVVAHRISSARRADRVLMMDGRDTAYGTHDDLVRRSARYRDLVGGWAPVPPRRSEPPLPLGDPDRVDAVAGPGLAGDGRHVVAHGPVGQVQAARDLRDGRPLRGEG